MLFERPRVIGPVVDACEIPAEADEPIWPEEFSGWYISHHPGITVPGNRALFVCTTTPDVACRMLAHPEVAHSFYGTSWNDLIESDYPHKDYVFQVDAEELCLDGTRSHRRFSLPTLPPTATAKAFYPPSAIGDGPQELDPERVADLLPTAPTRTPPGAPTSLEGQHAFFFTNFTVDTGEDRAIALPGGAHWWSPDSFPDWRMTLDALMTRHPTGTRHRPLSGVLTVPYSNDLGVEEWRNNLSLFLQRAKRLRTLLNVLHGSVPYIVATFSLHKRPQAIHEGIEVYTNITYSHWSRTFDLYHARLSPDQLASAAHYCLGNVSAKGLQADIVRALDSLDLARELHDRPISIVLTWAAIESLISPGKQEREITTNLALCLVGLCSPLAHPERLFKCAKDSYAVRSNIVHSFSLPGAKELDVATRFARHHAQHLIREAVAAAKAGLGRDQFRTSLMERVFDSRLPLSQQTSQ